MLFYKLIKINFDDNYLLFVNYRVIVIMNFMW